MATTPTWKLGQTPWEPAAAGAPGPRARVIIDNDFSGDPDGLVQLAHHVLSPSVDIRAIIGSHAHQDDPSHQHGPTAVVACSQAAEVFDLMGLDVEGRLVPGANVSLDDRSTPQDSPAARAIVAEAMRESDLPLFVACGGGLTDIASAYLLEPAIAERLTLIWIGGSEYAPPSDVDLQASGFGPEYNATIDPIATQVVFNDSDLRIWQVPRDVYKQCLMSSAELRRRVGRAGDLGQHLQRLIDGVAAVMWAHGVRRAETYPMGDSPLVLLTALTGFWVPDTSSSQHTVYPAPLFDGAGNQLPNADGRPIRVYTQVDNRLMFEDFYLKLEELAEWQASHAGEARVTNGTRAP